MGTPPPARKARGCEWFPSLAACNGATRRRLLPPAHRAAGSGRSSQAHFRFRGMDNFQPAGKGGRAARMPVVLSAIPAGTYFSCSTLLSSGYVACRMLPPRLPRMGGSLYVCSITCGAQSCNPPGRRRTGPGPAQQPGAKMHFILPLFRNSGQCGADLHPIKPFRPIWAEIWCRTAPYRVPGTSPGVRCRRGPSVVSPDASAGAVPPSPGRAARSSRSGPNRASGPSAPRGSA